MKEESALVSEKAHAGQHLADSVLHFLGSRTYLSNVINAVCLV